MALPTRRASDNKVETPSFFFVGDAGSGKTTMLAKAAKFLTAELGGKFLVVNMEPKDRTSTPEMLSCPPAVEVLDNPRWATILQIFTSEYRNYRAGLGIDGFDSYCRESFYDILGIADKPRFNIGQEFLGHQNAWHIQLHRMENHFRTLLEKGIPVIATCRLNYDKDEITGAIFKRTSAQGQAGLIVPPLFTVVGLCYYKSGAKEEWRIKFRPEYGLPARDTGGRLAADETADFAYLWRKVTSNSPAPATVGSTGTAATKPTGG